MLAGVWDGKVVRVFANGKLVGEASVPSSMGQNNDAVPFIIGAERVQEKEPNYHLKGVIEEVRISKVARYSKDYTPSKRLADDGDTMALYHCDEGEGNVLKDSSGHGHHGKIIGAKWVLRKDSSTASADPARKEPNATSTAWKPPAWGQSPLDQLDPSEIPASEHYEGEPKGLVAVIGKRGDSVGFCNASALSPDGKLFAMSGDGSFEITVWDVATRKVKWFIREKGDSAGPKTIRELRFSPDGKRLAVLYLYGEQWAWVYDISGDRPTLMRYQSSEKKGQPVALRYDGAGWWPWFEFAGSTLVFVHPRNDKESDLNLLDLSGAEPKLSEKDVKINHVDGLYFAPAAAEMLYVNGEGQLTRLPVKDGKIGKAVPVEVKLSPKGRLAAVSADGKRFAWHVDKSMLDKREGKVQVWEIAPVPRMLGEINNLGNEIRLSADGSVIWGYWDPGNKHSFYRVGPEGIKKEEGWELQGGHAAITPDHKFTLHVVHGILHFHDLTTLNWLGLSPVDSRSLCILPDKKSVPALDSKTGVFTLCGIPIPWKGRPYFCWSLAGRRPTLISNKDDVIELSFWPFIKPDINGRWLIDKGWGSEARGFTRVGPAGLGSLTNRFGPPNFAIADYSANGKFAILADRAGQRLVGWDCSDLQPSEAWSIEVPNEKPSQDYPLRLSADGARFVVCSQTKGQPLSIVVWDNKGPKPKTQLTIPITTPADEYRFAISPDGNTLFHNQHARTQIVVQDISGGKARDLAQLADKIEDIWGLAAHPGGKHVAWWGIQGAGVFDITTQEHIWQSRSGPYSVKWATFADDGRHLILLNGNATTCVVRLEELAGPKSGKK